MMDKDDYRAGDLIDGPDGERRRIVAEMGERVLTELHGKKAGEFRDERVMLRTELVTRGWRKAPRA